MSNANEKLVLDFVESWNRLDYDSIYSAMADDIFYHNIPMEPCNGLTEVKAFLNGAFNFDGAHWIVHAIATNGNMVLTERTDKFKMAGQWIEIRVMGTFEIENGKIAKWRDYFDLAEFQGQVAAVLKGKGA
ncbi:limonene-1,2-epoxide hydrolase family protein [Parasphingorhabdus sp. JC815]|uniref:limonene-1,2-epoxide hydrolase family protein n=1 Tax=Parasphingorhabdus sp. JC815 TaxID=3232140 RepID=UPI0034593839